MRAVHSGPPVFPMEKTLTEAAPAAPAAPQPIPVAKQPPALSAGRMRPTEAMRQTYSVLVETGTPRDAILKPEFWAHVAAKLRPMDHIEVMDDAGTWLAVLMVRSTGRTEALVALLWSAELAAPAAVDLPAEYTAEYKGLKAKWVVIRRADKTVIRDGMGSREEAESYIRSHVKAMAA